MEYERQVVGARFMTLASQTVVPLDDQTLVRCIHSDCSATIVKNIVRRRLRGSVPPACHLDNTQTSFVSYMLERSVLLVWHQCKKYTVTKCHHHHHHFITQLKT